MRRSTLVLALACLVGCGGSVSADESDTGGGGDDSSITVGDTSTLGDSVVGKDGTTVDAIGTDGAVKDSGTGDATTNPGDGGIACGTATCDPATQECCIEFAGGTPSAKCIDKGGTCGGGTLDCTNAAACASGQICCGSRDPTGGFGATCTAPSDCSTGSGGVQLCATDAECPTGERCRPAFGGVKICRAPFDGGGFDASGFDTKGFDTTPPG